MVERSLARLVSCRRLEVRYERRAADILLAFMHLARACLPQYLNRTQVCVRHKVHVLETIAGCEVPRRGQSGWRGLEAGDDAYHQTPCR